MNCPVCDAKLKTIEKQSVELDICPDCKGIWLDRGELEKLLDLTADNTPVREDSGRARDEHRDDDRGHEKHHEEHGKHERDAGYGHAKQKRKGSWLTDIMESFGGGD